MESLFLEWGYAKIWRRRSGQDLQICITPGGVARETMLSDLEGNGDVAQFGSISTMKSASLFGSQLG